MKPIEPMKALVSPSKPVVENPVFVAVSNAAQNTIADAIQVKEVIKPKTLSEKSYVNPLSRAVGLVDDSQWILQQDSKHYTLQLMALSEKGMLLKTQKKYKALGYETFYLMKKKADKESYLLFYGGFSNMDTARKIMQKLPEPLRNSWPRRFADIQKGLK